MKPCSSWLHGAGKSLPSCSMPAAAPARRMSSNIFPHISTSRFSITIPIFFRKPNTEGALKNYENFCTSSLLRQKTASRWLKTAMTRRNFTGQSAFKKSRNARMKGKRANAAAAAMHCAWSAHTDTPRKTDLTILRQRFQSVRSRMRIKSTRSAAPCRIRKNRIFSYPILKRKADLSAASN